MTDRTVQKAKAGGADQFWWYAKWSNTADKFFYFSGIKMYLTN